MNLSQIVVGGPGKIVDPNGDIFTEGDIVIEPRPVFRDVEASVLGSHDKVLVDLTWEITFTPKSVWNDDYRSVLLPAAYFNYTHSGVRMIGASDQSLSIVGADGNGFTFTRACLTQMPNLYLGLGRSLWGEAKYTAFIGASKELTDSDAFLATNTTGWSQSDFPTEHQESMCTLALGSVTGWSKVYAEEGFQLAHELRTEPVKQGNVTVDFKIVDYRAALTFTPQQPSTAQLLSAFSPVIGSRRSSVANDAVITDDAGDLEIKLHSVALERTPFVFSNRLNRHGEVALVTAMAGPGTRLTLVASEQGGSGQD